MRMQHFLLVATFVASGPALAADPKPGADASRTKPDAPSRAQPDPAWSLMASDKLQARPANRDRVRYTFPPATKRM